jgi:hypothetical protein
LPEKLKYLEFEYSYTAEEFSPERAIPAKYATARLVESFILLPLVGVLGNTPLLTPILFQSPIVVNAKGTPLIVSV